MSNEEVLGFLRDSITEIKADIKEIRREQSNTSIVVATLAAMKLDERVSALEDKVAKSVGGGWAIWQSVLIGIAAVTALATLWGVMKH